MVIQQAAVLSKIGIALCSELERPKTPFGDEMECFDH